MEKLNLSSLEKNFAHWEKTKDLIDQFIDIILNYRQSGHPGGSRSKVHALLTLMLSGAMRWDIRHPEKKYNDKFVLGAGHTIPLIYCTLAVLNESLRIKYQQTGDKKYLIPKAEERALYWEDLLLFRRRGGLSGHAEMEGKTLFVKFNTGPSGHGSPAGVGIAMSLKRAKAQGVQVFLVEGEGGLTPGANHEAMNSAWGLGLDNLYFLIDWNDYGIDNQAVSDVVYGTPKDWFSAHGWKTFHAKNGSDWKDVTQTFISMLEDKEPVPHMAYFKTRKGRDYLKYDNKSHGSPHKMNSELFWQIRQQFMDKYNVQFANYNQPAPDSKDKIEAEFKKNLQVVVDVLHKDQGLIDYLADTLVALGESVPTEISDAIFNKVENPFADKELYDYKNYPEELYAKPGEKLANRAGFSKWGSWVNAWGANKYQRPIFLACSADLADSTMISGFSKDFGDLKGYGWYNRHDAQDGALLPQEITEFSNSGIMAGISTVNYSDKPEEEFNGFYGTCSTYGSFSYLKYGMMRLLSQINQDCELKIGKVIWVAGHSGPETADDSRTHFGIFAPGVTKLFPKNQVIDLHPWEYNEVPVLLGAALQQKPAVIALHLTRPAVEIPDRKKLGMASHFEAAKGAYLVRDYQPDQPKDGTIIVQGTSAMASIVQLLPELEANKINLKIVCAASPQLFDFQDKKYKEKILSQEDWINSTVVTTQGRALMHDWIFSKVSEEYAISSDWDNRWRTGGTLDEVIDEAHLTPQWIMKGLEKFIKDKNKRLALFK
ncbi:MAG: transketolase [Spirochaetes bacterium]|nr:transketolase [Spirochaetota bacterium]